MNLPAASYSLKVLVSNVFAGCLIGSRGSSIKELIEVSGANVQVSGIKDTYPGTQDRIVLIMGSSSAINLAMSLVLELAAASNSLSPTAMRDWSPQEIVNHLGNYDAVNFAIKVTIPSSVGGAIIGKEGSTLRSMCEASGAKAVLSSKEDSIFTQERILTISGTTHEIRAFVELLLQKMTSEPETAQYVNSGTRYFANNAFHASKKGRDRPHTPRNPSEQDKASGVVTSEIVITMQIAESLIGQILGKKGSVLREIQSLSGAKVTVSPRENYPAANAMRTVTITGNPRAANIAHQFCTERIRQGARNSKPDGIIKMDV